MVIVEDCYSILLSDSHYYARGDVTVLDQFRSYDDLRFCVSLGRASFTAPPQFICGLPLLFSVVLHVALVIAIDLGTNQSFYHLPGTYLGDQRQKHALPLWNTCERTPRLGWIVARLEVVVLVFSIICILKTIVVILLYPMRTLYTAVLRIGLCLSCLPHPDPRPHDRYTPDLYEYHLPFIRDFV